MKFRSTLLELKEIEPGIIELQFHSPNSDNILNTATLKSLNKALHIIQAMSGVKGLIITSDKPHFLLGTDLDEIQSMIQFPKEELIEWLMYINTLFNQYENLPFPTVSVISGYAIGGGFEFTLATDFRVADASAIVGLPMTKLGIIPSLGGSVRLPRLIGIEKAIHIIAKNTLVPASCALKIGMIDLVSDQEHLLESALSVLKKAIHTPSDWQHNRKIKQAPIKSDQASNHLKINTINKLKAKKVITHYPAINALIESIEQSASKSLEQALEIERASFLKLTHSHQAKALLRVCLNEQFVKNRNLSLIGKETTPIGPIGILGTDVVNNEFALSAALNGTPTYFNSVSEAELLHNQSVLKTTFAHTSMNKQKLDKHLHLNSSYSDFEQCQVVIDCLNEDSDNKRSPLQRLEKSINLNTTLITTTKHQTIGLQQSNLIHPERFCGVHMHHPNSKLIEVIIGKKTSSDTLKTAIQLMIQCGKYPIQVKDQAGFFTSRVLMAYLTAFCNLASSGVNTLYIDKVMEEEFGWKKGPGKLIDEIGIDVVYQSIQQLHQHYSDTIALSDNNVLQHLFSASLFGVKSQAGFYKYPNKLHPSELSDKVCEFISEKSLNISSKEIIYRLMIPMLNEVVRCLEDEVISTPEEGDFALVHGLGFPTFRGGAFHLIDQITTLRYLTILQQYKTFGKGYQAPEILLHMQKNELVFYPITDKRIQSLQKELSGISA